MTIEPDLFNDGMALFPLNCPNLRRLGFSKFLEDPVAPLAFSRFPMLEELWFPTLPEDDDDDLDLVGQHSW